VAGRLIDAIEQETASDGHVSMLLDLLFPRDDSGRAPRVTAEGLSPTQVRAVRALAAMVERPKRVFYGHFPQWGLPDTNREWRALAAGRSPAVDPAAPMLADAARPNRPIRPDAILPGQRIRHRHFGEGTVVSASTGTQWTNLTVDFDDEGRKRLMFPPDGSPPR
jgi:hypothetical protein